MPSRLREMRTLAIVLDVFLRGVCHILTSKSNHFVGRCPRNHVCIYEVYYALPRLMTLEALLCKSRGLAIWEVTHVFVVKE